MPSPQSLVTFMVLLLILLLATHTQFGLSPAAAAFASLVLAASGAWVVDRRIPQEEEDGLDDVTDDGRGDHPTAD